ncbi:hypothetical protein BASA61_009428 [Batrachochytrium salamandrivorans]|nr:hypothetical protein BASA61_009428 [Batrachochytrium salamandrivorans]
MLADRDICGTCCNLDDKGNPQLHPQSGTNYRQIGFDQTVMASPAPSICIEPEDVGPVLREGTVMQRTGHLGIASRRFLMAQDNRLWVEIPIQGTHSNGNSRYSHANLYGSTVQHTEKLANGDTASSASMQRFGMVPEGSHRTIPNPVARSSIGLHVLAHITQAVLQDVPFLINMSADLPQTALHALPVIVPLNSNMALVSEEDIGSACLFELVTAEAGDRMRFQADMSTEYLAWFQLLSVIVQPARSLLAIEHQLLVDDNNHLRRKSKLKSVAVAASATLKMRQSMLPPSPESIVQQRQSSHHSQMPLLPNTATTFENGSSVNSSNDRPTTALPPHFFSVQLICVECSAKYNANHSHNSKFCLCPKSALCVAPIKHW